MSQDADDEPEYVASVPIGVGSNPRDLLACRTCGIIKAAVQVRALHQGCALLCLAYSCRSGSTSEHLGTTRTQVVSPPRRRERR